MRRRIELPKFTQEKVLIVPLVMIGFMIISIIGAFILISRLRTMLLDIKTYEEKIVVLTAKKDVLTQLDKTQTQSLVNTTTRALPDASQVLSAVARIRDLAQDSGLTIVQIQVSGAAGKGSELLNVDIGLDIEGAVTSIEAFSRQIEKSLPILVIQDGQLSAQSGLAQANLTLKTFWSKLPTQLPDVATPIDSLTPEEQKLVTDITGFTGRRVQFTGPSGAPVNISPRPNPFSF